MDCLSEWVQPCKPAIIKQRLALIVYSCYVIAWKCFDISSVYICPSVSAYLSCLKFINH